MKLFSLRRKAAVKELARQLTIYDRKAQEIPGAAPGPLPYGTYDLMQRDAMIQTALSVKRQGVLAAKFRVEPASDSAGARRNAEFVEENFARMEGSPATILDQAMDAFGKGWSVQESIYEAAGSQVWLKEVRAKDPATFGLRVDSFGRVLGLELDARLASSAGAPHPLPLSPQAGRGELPRDKFVIYANRGGYGRTKGRSDLDAAYPHWVAKTKLLEAWRLHLERFASPTVLGKYQRGLPPDEASSLLGPLEGLSKRTAIVYPSEIEIGTLGVSKEFSTGFMDAVEFHNREIARSILGQTLTTDEGRRVGSLALGKVHLQVLLLQLQALRKDLADRVMTEQVIRPLVELNFGPEEVPVFRFEEVPLEAFSSGAV
jgi:phage gp29-like protein